MNNTLKQAIFVVISIFLFGWLFDNEEISNVLKQGIGMTIMCAGIIMGIGVFFPLNVDVIDKVICIFWAGALFIIGATLHKAGLSWAILACSIYLVFMAIYFSPLIESETRGLMIAVGIALFVIGMLLFIISENSPTIKSFDQPTEKPYIEDNYDYPCQWNLWVTSYGKKPGIDWPHTFYLGSLTGTLKEARVTAKQMMEKWEAQNPYYNLLDKDNLIADKHLVFDGKIKKP